jgi:hypothetical protein
VVCSSLGTLGLSKDKLVIHGFIHTSSVVPTQQRKNEEITHNTDRTVTTIISMGYEILGMAWQSQSL